MPFIIVFTVIIFLTTFLFVFFELSYRGAKRSWLQSINNNQSTPPENFLKHLAKKLNWGPGFILPKIFKESYLINLLRQSGRPFNLTISEFTTLHRLLGELTIIFIFLFLIFSGFTLTNSLFSLFLWLFIVYLPIFWLKIITNRRIYNFNNDFSSFIDMVALTVQAGMNFDNALFYTANKFHGVLHEEFKYVQYETNYGHSLAKSLNNLTTRINSSDLRRFVTAIKQAKRLGTPLVQTLTVQSNLILTGRIQRAEELSRTASIKISIPLVFFIFPALLILYLAPAILQFMNR